jgi:hypothetical protein
LVLGSPVPYSSGARSSSTTTPVAQRDLNREPFNREQTWPALAASTLARAI